MSGFSTHAHGIDSQHDSHAHHGPDREFLLRADNINLPSTAGKGLANALLGAGVIGVGLALFGSTLLGPEGKAHSLASIHVGLMSALAMCLGSLFWVLVLTLVRAGWHGTIKRQLENVSTLIPFVGVGIIAVLILDAVFKHPLFTWMNEFQGDYLLEKKSAFLNPAFFYVRILLYIFVWTFLARRMSAYSLEQDRTADRWLTAKAGYTSAWGMLAFALSLAFGSFDLLMSLDFRFFSTMWGVYYFAGSAYSGMALCILITAVLRRAGKLQGVVTEEHNHDMGKLLFAFTVFWAYIAFSQYFLIWYSNIPEETAYKLARQTNGWEDVFYFLAFGHFLVPFLIMLFRPIKKSTTTLAAMAGWAIIAHVADIFWIIRPMTYAGAEHVDKIGRGGLWVDVAGIAGVLAIFASLVVRKVTSGTLVAVNDPRMDEALSHKNYV